MQRDIKFRAWNRIESRMETVNFIKWNKAQYAQISTRFYDKQKGKNIDDWHVYGHEDGGDNVILMQYTGLKDKNGKEIYEGDIVVGYFNCKKIIGWIFYGSDATFFIQREGLYGIGLNNVEDWAEIIGNIYENPELLKE